MTHALGPKSLCSNNVEKCEQLGAEYAALLDQSRSIQEDGQRLRQLRHRAREATQELERLRLQVRVTFYRGTGHNMISRNARFERIR